MIDQSQIFKTDLLAKALQGQTPLSTSINLHTNQIEIRFTTRRSKVEEHPVISVGSILVHPTTNQVHGFLVYNASLTFTGTEISNAPRSIPPIHLAEVCKAFGLSITNI